MATATSHRPPGPSPQASGFIGREAELAQVRGLLRRSRLVTVTGPAGVGKTRLALRTAEELAGRPERPGSATPNRPPSSCSRSGPRRRCPASTSRQATSGTLAARGDDRLGVATTGWGCSPVSAGRGRRGTRRCGPRSSGATRTPTSGPPAAAFGDMAAAGRGYSALHRALAFSGNPVEAQDAAGSAAACLSAAGDSPGLAQLDVVDAMLRLQAGGPGQCRESAARSEVVLTGSKRCIAGRNGEATAGAPQS